MEATTRPLADADADADAGPSQRDAKRRVSPRRLAQTLARAGVLLAVGFLALALLGLGVQLYRRAAGGQPASDRLQARRLQAAAAAAAASSANTNKDDEGLASLALATTYLALSLWGRLLLSILIPTTEISLVYAEEGWTALQPSLVQGVHWFVAETSVQFKLAVASALVAMLGVWLLEREIKRRRIVERVRARVDAVASRVRAAYDAFRAEVERESRIAAFLLPHVIFAVLAGFVWLSFHDTVHDLARGFLAWGVVVGWPVTATTRKLLEYDSKSDAREEDVLETAVASATGLEEQQQQQQLPPSRRSSHASTSSTTAGGEGPKTPLAKLVQPAQDWLTDVLLRVRDRVSSDDMRVRNSAVDAPVLVASSSSSSAQAHAEETAHCVSSMLYWLRYWSVLSVALLLEQFPGTGHFLALMPVWPELRLLTALWLQLPGTRGADLAFEFVVPLLDRYFKKLEAKAPASLAAAAAAASSTAATDAAAVAAAAADQRNLVLRLLVSSGMISDATRSKLVHMIETGGSLVMTAFPFLISPSFVTKIGVLIVGLAFPAHASATVVLRVAHVPPTALASSPPLIAPIVRWLQYWVVYAVFALVHGPIALVFGFWFPLFDQIHLLLLLWLQLPFFRGATGIFYVCLVVGRVMRRMQRQRAAKRRRGRTSSIASPAEKLVSIMPEAVVHRFPSMRRMAEEEEEEEKAAAAADAAARTEVVPVDDDDAGRRRRTSAAATEASEAGGAGGAAESTTGSTATRRKLRKGSGATVGTRFSAAHTVNGEDDLGLVTDEEADHDEEDDDDDGDDGERGGGRAFESMLLDDDADVGGGEGGGGGRIAQSASGEFTAAHI